MRAMSVMRFVVLGAAGFGLGEAIAGASGDAMLAGFFTMGALGGASLGLAANGWRRSATMALTGALGFGVGFAVAFFIVITDTSGPSIRAWVPEGQWFIGAVGGALGGASLGVAFATWRRIVALAVAGALGFGISWGAVDAFIQFLLEPGTAGMWRSILFMAIEGGIGGASLGAALGYLEKRKPKGGRRPGVG